MKITSNKIHQRKHKENKTHPYGLHASFLPLVGLPLTVPLPEKLKRKMSSGSVERTHQSRDPEGCTYQSSDPEGYTYQSSDPEGCTYQCSDPEGCTYQSSDPEGCIYQSSDPEGYTYQSSDPEGYTYQSSDPEGCTYQSSDPKGCTYQFSDPEGYTYQELTPIKPAVKPENSSVNSVTPSREERRGNHDRLVFPRTTAVAFRGRRTEERRPTASWNGGRSSPASSWLSRLWQIWRPGEVEKGVGGEETAARRHCTADDGRLRQRRPRRRQLAGADGKEKGDIKVRKRNGIAFQSVCEDNYKQSLKAPENENLAEAVALLSRRSSSANVNLPSRRQDQGRSTSYKDKSEKSNKSVRCHDYEDMSSDSECEDYGKALISCEAEGRTQSLEDVLSMAKLRKYCEGLGYDGDQSSSKRKALVFVRATDQKYLKEDTSDLSDINCIEELHHLDMMCSRHMIGNSLLFTDLIECKTSRVTFKDGVKGNVMEKGNIDLLEAPKLKNARLIEGLSANLISIHKLCDKGYYVKFSKEKCEVLNDEQQMIMSGIKLVDIYH
ncbi:NBS-LRR type resistance protein [Cucumis melo var. makuwa]|uniref:NBS-LRR type resistance protein n=2 Tax=Cucumis melo var. makuwa TaxID=1194695 RepID=A0A5A7UPP1_CUCMM|nr:NBS-LRR type resistance protein [Cucumis melo var. makuwa]